MLAAQYGCTLCLSRPANVTVHPPGAIMRLARRQYATFLASSPFLLSKILKDMPRIKGRPGETLPPLDFDDLRNRLEDCHPNINDTDVMSAALYPEVTEDYLNFRETYGPVDKLGTRIFLTGPKVGEEFEVAIEKGKTLGIKTLAVAEDLTENGDREVFFELNGQLRSVFIKDKEAVKVKLP
ncbi:hypothetical protein QAD02_002904 [Eretmocerus hayati]|uniref:Uncharacterized protein n=1 Tax=Eretmocerus hayati TaxID=131215 RepID=A0ACC2NKD3_9HYME|nr:hypothetical protein QAD02_002904 [Eretmocerus hayati]